MSPLIQNPDIARKLQQGLRLTHLPDSVLAPETVPVIVVEDFSAPLGAVSLGCAGGLNVAAVAAENPMVGVRRIGTGYRAKITRAIISTPSTQIVRISAPTVALTGLAVSGETSFTDFSAPGRPSSELLNGTNVGLFAAIDLYVRRLLSNEPWEIFMDLELGVGTDAALIITGDTVNTQITVSLDWTELPPFG